MLHKRKNKDSGVRFPKKSNYFLQILEVLHPKTERISQIQQIRYGEADEKEYFELDIDGRDNMFNMSIEDKNRSITQPTKGCKSSVDVEKILHNMNHIPTKPVLLTTNPITKEDPSWGTGTQKAHHLVHLAEEKGHYEHLSTFLEDTIHKRREVACTSIVPYPLEDPSKPSFHPS